MQLTVKMSLTLESNRMKHHLYMSCNKREREHKMTEHNIVSKVQGSES